MYEEDIIPAWESHTEIKDRVRETVYSKLYQRTYKYSTTKAKSSNFDPEEFDNGSGGVSPASSDESKEVKPFIPVSSEADLMKVLDSPMG